MEMGKYTNNYEEIRRIFTELVGFSGISWTMWCPIVWQVCKHYLFVGNV
jgi:hypothetical protein